jgi:hypothetical protein
VLVGAAVDDPPLVVRDARVFRPGLRGSSYSARNTMPTMLPLVSTVTTGIVSLPQVGVRGGGPKYLTTFARPDVTFGLCCK